jgi:hypothetical protein
MQVGILLARLLHNSMNRHSSMADKTAVNRVPGSGMNMLRLALLCNHKTSTTGALMRGSMVMLCAACNAQKKAT